jgi:hypothetical protein
MSPRPLRSRAAPFAAVAALLLMGFSAHAASPANTGRSAMDCVSAQREGSDVAFHNRCAGQVFVVWCGDLKYSKKRCGDGPAGNSYYTHSTNVKPGDKGYARGVGDYRFAACEGSIAFGKDEIRDQPDGSFVCVPFRAKDGGRSKP